MSASLAIRCAGLRKRHPARGGGVDAVNGLDLEVRSGECFGMLGPNGAGKTTTIEILEGLMEPTSGEVDVLGLPWRGHAAELRQRIGISLQETRFAEKLTVEETLRLFRSFYRKGMDPNAAIDRVTLGEKRRAWVGKLSGGQRQRLAVACALVGDPELLFLDEPTTGLDPQSRRQLWDIIRDFRARGRTVLLTTHYMDEAERLCDRVAVVDQGRLIALGSPAELIARLGGEHVIEMELVTERDHESPLSHRHGADPPEETGNDRLVDSLRALPAVSAVRREGQAVALTVTEPHVALPGLLRHLETEALELARLTTRHASLEDVFVTLTGRHLRDDQNPSA